MSKCFIRFYSQTRHENRINIVCKMAALNLFENIYEKWLNTGMATVCVNQIQWHKSGIYSYAKSKTKSMDSD